MLDISFFLYFDCLLYPGTHIETSNGTSVTVDVHCSRNVTSTAVDSTVASSNTILMSLPESNKSLNHNKSPGISSNITTQVEINMVSDQVCLEMKSNVIAEPENNVVNYPDILGAGSLEVVLNGTVDPTTTIYDTRPVDVSACDVNIMHMATKGDNNVDLSGRICKRNSYFYDTMKLITIITKLHVHCTCILVQLTLFFCLLIEQAQSVSRVGQHFPVKICLKVLTGK